MFTRLLCASLFFSAAATFAAHDYVFTGTLHNDRNAHRATLETATGRYLLDYQGTDLYHIGERYDREQTVVEGELIYGAYERYPVLRVDKITFRPYRGRAMTYRVGEPQYEYYTTYERPVRERRYVRRYYRD